MKTFFLSLLTLCVFLNSTVFADNNLDKSIKIGMKADLANEIMLFHKFESSPLQMSATDNNKLLFFKVNEHVLIITYSPNDNLILRIDYYISNYAGKSNRFKVYLKVIEFFPTTKKIVIDLSEAK